MKRQVYIPLAVGSLVVGAILIRATWPTSPEVPRHVGDARPSEIGTRVATAYGNLPLHFEANNGQTDARVKFLVRGIRHTLFLTPNEAVLVLTKPPAAAKNASAQERARTTEIVLQMTLLGANPRPRVVGLGALPGKANYFIGNEPRRWRQNVPLYAEVQYGDVYPGIDLRYTGDQRQVAYHFVVRPGADPSKIVLDWQGVDSLEVGTGGDLALHTGADVLRLPNPGVYYEPAGSQPVARGYVRIGVHQVGFAVSRYDVSRPLVISGFVPFVLPPLNAAAAASAATFDATNDSVTMAR